MVKRFVRLLYSYFGSRSDYFMNWLASVVKGESTDRAIMINDCSFSHRFTLKILRLLKKVSDKFQVLCLIQASKQKPLKGTAAEISFDVLGMMLKKDIMHFGLKWNSLRSAKCIIIIPYSFYLHHEVCSNGCFVVVTVNEKYRSLSRENNILRKYKNIKRKINLASEFRSYLLLF